MFNPFRGGSRAAQGGAALTIGDESACLALGTLCSYLSLGDPGHGVQLS